MIKVITFALLANSMLILGGLALAILQAPRVGPKALLWFVVPLAGNVLATLVLMVLRLKPFRPKAFSAENLSPEARFRAWRRLRRLITVLKYVVTLGVPFCILAKWLGLSRILFGGETNPLGVGVGVVVILMLSLSPWILLYGSLYRVDGSFLWDEDPVEPL